MKPLAELWGGNRPPPVQLFPNLIELSEEDLFIWEMLQAVLAHQRRHRSPESIDGPLLDWALDIAQGKRAPPRRPGRQLMANAGRNGMIAGTVDKIRRMGNRPATSNKQERESSACHLVADRVHLSYEAVRSIWQDELSRTLGEAMVQ